MERIARDGKRKQLIELIFEEVQLDARDLAEKKGLNVDRTVRGTNKHVHESDMMFMHVDTFYTPFHWLAYHNDANSIEYLLSKLNHESIDDMIFM